MTTPPIPPAQPQPSPKSPKSPADLRRERYDTTGALEVFEHLLLAAARIPIEGDPAGHPLVLIQAAKALVGLRPHDPSQSLIDFAVDQCPTLPLERPVAALVIPPDQLGATVAVFELEDAVAAGDLDVAREQ
ncbi:MAG: hypothetical protein V3W14_10410, partial [Candidatus Neomarinimicrobiota bacterium]